MLQFLEENKQLHDHNLYKNKNHTNELNIQNKRVHTDINTLQNNVPFASTKSHFNPSFVHHIGLELGLFALGNPKSLSHSFTCSMIRLV